MLPIGNKPSDTMADGSGCHQLLGGLCPLGHITGAVQLSRMSLHKDTLNTSKLLYIENFQQMDGLQKGIKMIPFLVD